MKKQSAKVIKIPFHLRGRQRELNEVIHDVSPSELAHFGGIYLETIVEKHKPKPKKEVLEDE